MDWTNNEQRILQSTVEWVEGSLPQLARLWEQERRVGVEGLAQAAAIGLTGLQVPLEQGGQAVSFRCKAAVAQCLARGDFGFAMSLINTHNVAARVADGFPADIVARYLPGLLAGKLIGCTALTEPHAGSDFSAINTLAQKSGDDWLISGQKAWIINAAVADLCVMYVQTDPAGGARGIAGVLVDVNRDGIEREPAYAMAGQHSIGAGGFSLREYRASPEEMFLPPGKAFASALGSINGARIYVAAMCCGMVASALASVREYGLHRRTFGQTLHGHQGWRWILAEAAAELDAARAQVDVAAGMIDAGVDAQFAAAKSKVFATRMAERHLGALMQAMGAEGLRDHYPLARHRIGVQMASLTDGSTQMLLDRIAANLGGDNPQF